MRGQKSFEARAIPLKKPFEVFVNAPGDGGGWKVGEDSWPNATKETCGPMAVIDDPKSIEQAASVPYPRIVRISAGLKKGLANVQWSGGGGGKRAGQAAGNDVSFWIIGARRIKDATKVLVSGELDGLERHRHGEGGWIRDIEGGEALNRVHLAGAFEDICVGAALNLHPLLHDIKRIHESIAGYSCTGASGSGGKEPRTTTVASKSLLRMFIHGKVERVCWAGSKDHRVDPPP